MEDMMKIEFESNLSIDEYRLDEEWIKQPKLYFQTGDELAEARRELDEVKTALDITKAEIDREIRQHPENFGIAKITEKVVESTIVLDKRYQKGVKAVLDAKHLVDVLDTAVRSLDHRKTALVKLVDLRLAEYFSKPTASTKSKERMDEVEKESVRRRGVRKRENK